MMSSSSSGRSCSSRFPFTASQWQELEHQALVFKYMVCGMPIPPDLLFTIRRSFDSSLSSSSFLIHHQPHHHLSSVGIWNSSSSFQIGGFGRKIDPEPGRCRRTDGKKWRCSKDAYPDSKYCERHMHRGRNRSRKPVETTTIHPTTNTSTTAAPSQNAAISINNTKNTPHFLYPQFPSSRVSPALALSSQQTTNNFFLDSNHADFRNNSSYGHGGGYSSDLPSGQKMLNDHNFMQQERDEQPKKVMHHFLDECPPKHKHSNWTHSEDKMPNHTTQLSISIPNSLHDFFITQKWILHWQPNPGTTVNSQILSEISQCAESINGVKDGRWKSTLTFYKAMGREQAVGNEFPRDFVGISLAEQPSKYFLVIRGQRLVVEAETSIQTLMEKLQSYKLRVALNFEGNQYQLGDFQLRVGKVVPMHSESLRGIVMEMEYRPISSWEKAHQIMGEFFDLWQEALSKRSLPGHFVHIEPNFTEYGLQDQYTVQHTAVQYASITAQMIATSQPVQAMRN